MSTITNHKTQLTSLRPWTGTAFLSQKKRWTKSRSVCKNAETGLGWELQAPADRLLPIFFIFNCLIRLFRKVAIHEKL